MGAPMFDRLFVEGRRAVLAGEHTIDVPPRVPSERWGPSVCLRPSPGPADSLSSLTDEALEAAGPAHWPTGRAASSHFTVRVLDRFRADLDPDHPDVAGYLAATGRAAARTAPVRLRVTGLTLTRGSVMASAEPVDGAAAGFASALAEELGGAGWYEADVERTIWYTNLVHFAGPVTTPRALVDWVADRRRLDLDVTTCDRAELLDWGYDGGQMVPVRLGSVPFAR